MADEFGGPGTLHLGAVYSVGGPLKTLHGNKGVKGHDWAEFTFKAPKGKRFVVMFVGAEPTDGTANLDVDALLRSMGWEFKGKDPRPRG